VRVLGFSGVNGVSDLNGHKRGSRRVGVELGPVTGTTCVSLSLLLHLLVL
jgi:hypothetical protein